MASEVQTGSTDQSVEDLRRELAAAREQQAATSNILRVISRSPTELAPVFDTILADATRLCEGNFAGLWQYDGEALVGAAQHNLSPEFAELCRNTKIQLGPAGPIRKAAQERRTIHVADITVEPGFSPIILQYENARTVLAVPLLRQANLAGVIGIWRREVRPFTEQQIALVGTFADQAVIAIENARLLNELRESLQQQTATADVLKAISRSAFDLQPVLDALVESAAKLCEADQGGMVRKQGSTYITVATYGHSLPSTRFLRASPLNVGRDTITGRVILEGRAIQVGDVLEDPELDTSRYKVVGTRTILAVPLLREGAPIGVFVLSRRTVRPFTDKQIELVTTFADQAVIAIENTRLFEEVQARTGELTEALEFQTATSEILRTISSAPTQVQPVFDAIAVSANKLCGALLTGVYRFDGKLIDFVAHNNWTDEGLATVHRAYPRPPSRETQIAKAIVDRTVVEVRDFDVDSEVPEQSLRLARALGYRSLLAVPMLHEGNPIGAIAVARSEPGPFSVEHIELVKTFADQAVIAIENTRLFEEVQARNRDLRIALEQQTATSELLKVIGRSTFELQPVFDTLAENAVRLCSAERAFVHRFDGQVLRVVATHNVSPELRAFVERNPMTPGRYSVAARAALERRTVSIDDVQADPEITYAARGVEPVRTALSVPMLRSDELLGVIMIYRHEVRPFTDNQVTLIETFADQAAIAIENARLLEELQARNRDLTALGEVGRAVSSTLDLKVVLKAVVDRAVELSGTDAASIYYLHPKVGTFELGETTGLDADVVAKLRKLDIFATETGLGEAIANRQPLQAPDVTKRASNPLRDAALEAGLHAALIVPLLGSEGALGALVLQRRRTGEFTPTVVSLMQSFADQSAIALENARLFGEIALKSRELEIASQHKSQFVANMSHELRTPLAAVLGYAELLQEGIYGALPEKSLPILTRIRSNGKHLLGLINTVLDISKIEAGQFKLNCPDSTLAMSRTLLISPSRCLPFERMRVSTSIDFSGSGP